MLIKFCSLDTILEAQKKNKSVSLSNGHLWNHSSNAHNFYFKKHPKDGCRTSQYIFIVGRLSFFYIKIFTYSNFILEWLSVLSVRFKRRYNIFIFACFTTELAVCKLFHYVARLWMAK